MKTLRIREESFAETIMELQVCHPNGDTKWLVIEAWAERWICVRWPMAGQYDVMLKDGRLVARSEAARRKHPINPWRAVDKLECRDWVAEKMGISKEHNDERYRLHHERMPGPKHSNFSSEDKDSANRKRNG